MNQVLDQTITPASLGCEEYKKNYNLKYAYVSGGMFRGVASRELVVKMGKAGLLGYFGSGGLGLDEIEKSILYIKNELPNGESYGMNLLNTKLEKETIELFLKHEVTNIEAAAFLNITPSLVKFRLKGLKRNEDGSISAKHRIMGKLSRPEIAEMFLSPPPVRIVKKLLKENAITAEQAELAPLIPVATDICVEADSAGHTDQGAFITLIPAILQLRDEMKEKFNFQHKVSIGAAGGIGTPQSAAAAFIIGADFILTGSINQCTVEAGISSAAKDLLQSVNVQDTDYAPAGDMFEIGAKVQVVRKGVFFPARANKLYEIYRQYDALEDLDEKTRDLLQNKFFKRSFDDIYMDVKSFFSEKEIQRAEKNPKQKMAYIFRWYFAHAIQLAMQGNEEGKVDYQIFCGPSLGAFNQWVKGSDIEKWQNRHVDDIGKRLMEKTADYLNTIIGKMTSPSQPAASA